MNSLLAALGRKLISGAGGLGGGISSSVFSSCFRRASLAAAWRLAGDSADEAPLLGVELAWAEDGVPLSDAGEAFQEGDAPSGQRCPPR